MGPWPTLALLGDMLASLEDMVLSLDPVPLVELALLEVMASLEDMVWLEDMVSLEVLVLALARCPTSLCTSPCRARTGESPSQRPSDPLLLLLLTTLAPPMASAPTG